jgi:hypothetical protein
LGSRGIKNYNGRWRIKGCALQFGRSSGVGIIVLYRWRDALPITLCIKSNIMRIINKTIKDLQQIIRDWKAALFLITMPIGFTLLFGYVFGEQPKDDQEDSRFSVALAGMDDEKFKRNIIRIIKHLRNNPPNLA